MIRIDAHHHVWNLEAREQPWIVEPDMNRLRRNFDVEDLRAAAADDAIAATVVVQTVADTRETVELLELADRTAMIAGVVGYVDVASSRIDDELDELGERPTAARLVGVRSLVQYETDPGWLERDDVVLGFRAIADRGLVHDLLIVPSQIAAAVDAVRRVPEGTFVVDHLAKPDIAGQMWEPWASGTAALAGCPNVVAKLSGLVTEARWSGWTDDDLRPYVEHALETFGPGRLLFGSDWPVCTLAASYHAVVTTAAALVSALDLSEQLAIFGGNAIRTYALEPLLSGAGIRSSGR